MQLLVVGMHRSGTSMLTRILNLMGAYVGEEGSLTDTGIGFENPKGFWERRDVRRANEDVMFATGCDWDLVSKWDVTSLPESALTRFKAAAQLIALKLDANRPWVIKDPRLCLTLGLWRKALECPCAILPLRHPLEVAESLQTRNEFPLPLGLALWEQYMISAVAALDDMPYTAVVYSDMLAKPESCTGSLLEALQGLGETGLRMPATDELRQFVDGSLYRSRIAPHATHLSDHAAIRLFEALKSGADWRSVTDGSLSTESKACLLNHEKIQGRLVDRLKQQVSQPIATSVLPETSSASVETESSHPASEEKLRTAIRQLQTARKRVESLTAALSDMKLCLSQAENRNRQLVAEAACNQKHTDALERRLINLQASADQYIDEIEALRMASLDSKNAAFLVNERSHQQYTEMIVRMAEDREKLTKQLMNSLADNDRLMDEVQKHKASIVDTEKEKNRLHQRLTGAVKAAKLDRARIEELEKQISQMRSVLDVADRMNRKQAHALRSISIISQKSEDAARSILDSARWRIGDRMVRMLEVVLLRARPALASEYLMSNLDKLNKLSIQAAEQPASMGPDRTTSQQQGKGAEATDRPASSPPSIASKPQAVRDIALLGERIAYAAALVSKSRRWSIGSLAVRPVEIVLRRSQESFATDELTAQANKLPHALRRLASLLEARSNDPHSVGGFAVVKADALRTLDRIRVSLDAIVRSKRWKIGSAIIAPVEKMLWWRNRESATRYLMDRVARASNIIKDMPDHYLGDSVTPTQAISTMSPVPHRAWSGDNSDRRPAAATRVVRHTTDQVPTVDVIVPVFNALADTKRCLNSIKRCRSVVPLRIIIVNDGSDAETTSWLQAYVTGNDHMLLIEHPENRGYTKAINTGLRAGDADVLVLLNSDTIVTTDWLDGILACFDSDPLIGIVGPMSNAATWQNLPALRDDAGAFAINRIPAGIHVDRFARMVHDTSERLYPRVNFVNGFCFAMRRETIEKVGFFDEENFPVGYGEENDYCIRAANAGFQLAICDDVFVYHSKSKSFGSERRTELSRRGADALRTKHGTKHFTDLLEAMPEQTKVLEPARQRLQSAIQEQQEASRSKPTIHSVDMHGTPIGLHPRPAFAGDDYALDPPIGSSALTIPLSCDGSNLPNEPSLTHDIGIHVHLHYPEMLLELTQYLRNIPTSFSLYVSVGQDQELLSIHRALDEALPNARKITVKTFPNRGRDIAPFIVGFAEQLRGHEIICHLHTKRSPHNSHKADWRRQLLGNLLPNAAHVATILELFGTDTQLGLVFPEYHHSLASQISWGTNFPAAKALADRMEIDINPQTLALFPAGSMFWARSLALEPLLSLGLQWEDFPEEHAQVDGTPAHAIERLFGEIVSATGFSSLQVRSEKPHNLIHYHPKKWPYEPEASQSALIENIKSHRKATKSKASRIVVYSAVTGAYDNPVFHEHLDDRIRYVMFSDSPDLVRNYPEARPIPVEDLTPVRTARWVKTHPHELFPDCDVAIWIDGNAAICGDIWPLVERALLRDTPPVLGISHPMRNCTYLEGEAVVNAGKAERAMVEAQLSEYRRQRYPESNGLIETNFMVLRLSDPSCSKFLDAWWREIDAFTHRDQLSVNYALWKSNVDWAPLFEERMSLRDHPDFRYFGHGKNSGYSLRD